MADGSAPSRLGEWMLGAQLGRGGMGVVHVATNVRTGERRALKVIAPGPLPSSPDALSRLEREIAICVGLRHSNVVLAEGFVQEDGVHALVMELCEGGSLADLVGREGPLPADQAVPLFLGVLDALHYAHSVRGLVHRDVKPHNILLGGHPSDRPVAKLADFGLAKAYETAGLSGLTRTGSVGGSPAFMPRAQVINYKYAGPSVDVWSTAASLYYALTAHLPREFPTGRDPWLAVATSPVVPIRERDAGLPDRLTQVMDQALAEGPGGGFASAELFRSALQVI